MSILSMSILADVGLGIKDDSLGPPPPSSILVLVGLGESVSLCFTNFDSMPLVGLLLPAGLLSGEDSIFLGDAEHGVANGDNTGDFFNGA